MRASEKNWNRFVIGERAAETLEYGIITGLIVISAIMATSAIGVWVTTRFHSVQAVVGV